MKLLDYKDVSELTGIRAATLRVWAVRGQLPEPDFNKDKPLWTEETIRKWMNSKEQPET